MSSTEFAISNVQCLYETPPEDVFGTRRVITDHTYDMVDEPPTFIIRKIDMSKSSDPLPVLEMSPTKLSVEADPIVNVIHIAENRPQQSSHESNKRIRRSEELLSEAATCVTKGQTFQTVSAKFNIPISTIRFFMARKGILPQRKRGRQTLIQSSSPEPPFYLQHFKLPMMPGYKSDEE